MQSHSTPSQLGMFHIGADTLGMFQYIAHWIISYGHQTVTSRNPKIPQDAPNKIAVYCAHGIMDHPLAFGLLFKKLLDTLPESITSISLLSFRNYWGFGSIEEDARQLAEAIKTNGDHDVILLGHSRGGLVVAYFAEYLAKQYGITVHTVIPICAPFKGSNLAAWAWPLGMISSSIVEMAPNSAFLKDLNEKVKNSETKYFFCGAEKDGVVAPENSVVEKENSRSQVFLKHGHLSIMVGSEKLVAYLRERFVKSVKHIELHLLKAKL